MSSSIFYSLLLLLTPRKTLPSCYGFCQMAMSPWELGQGKRVGVRIRRGGEEGGISSRRHPNGFGGKWVPNLRIQARQGWEEPLTSFWPTSTCWDMSPRSREKKELDQGRSCRGLVMELCYNHGVPGMVKLGNPGWTPQQHHEGPGWRCFS